MALARRLDIIKVIADLNRIETATEGGLLPNCLTCDISLLCPQQVQVTGLLRL